MRDLEQSIWSAYDVSSNVMLYSFSNDTNCAAYLQGDSYISRAIVVLKLRGLTQRGNIAQNGVSCSDNQVSFKKLRWFERPVCPWLRLEPMLLMSISDLSQALGAHLNGCHSN